MPREGFRFEYNADHSDQFDRNCVLVLKNWRLLFWGVLSYSLDCPIVSTKATTRFEYIQEKENEFLSLFAHRYDYIWAEQPLPQERAEWKTESRYPLSDRLIYRGTHLYGVRFGAETQYCLLDIDIGSAYHPNSDPLAIARLIAALEPLGLVSYISCTSSYSGGLHLYLPFQQPQSSWKLAIAVSTLLENAGFKLIPGQLEVFPNPKPYSIEGTPSLFNAHRLPLQIGSYLLDETFQPIWTDQDRFIRQWEFAQKRNDFNKAALKQIIKQAKRRHFQVSGKADKFINDLNAEIELGWTGQGQTNRLLGRIAMRSYIFHHILSGGEPLQGQALVDEIVEIARSLPGYTDWCNHQHEIEHRAEEWARCVENSHYFHYGDPKGKFKAKASQPELNEAIEKAPTWNQQQAEAARDRIKRAIADLLEKEVLPSRATARFRALLQYNIGGGVLYRHRDLWHPSFLGDIPPDPPSSIEVSSLDCVKDASNEPDSTSLLYSLGGDSNGDEGLSNRTVQSFSGAGGNFSEEQLSRDADLILIICVFFWEARGKSGRFKEDPIRHLGGSYERCCFNGAWR